MAEMFLRPDLKTAGGEVSDIMYKGRFVGSLLLVFREKDRISGAVQLEKESLSSKEKQRVIQYVTRHIQSMIDALKAAECDVLVTYSSFDHVIATNETEIELEDELQAGQEDADFEWVNDSDDVGDWSTTEETVVMQHPEHRYSDDLEEEEADVRNPVYYELVATKETKNKIEYHVYAKDQEWIAEVFLRIKDNDITGDIHWMFNPMDEEIEHVTDLLVSDFDPDLVDTFVLNHHFEGNVVETIELTHEDLLDEAQEHKARNKVLLDDYTIVLARDDQDMLTYEIYDQVHGGFPIGTATVDISRKQLSGFIDFREEVDKPGEREKIATLVMQELDKEKEYDTISFTMLYRNKPIDEIVFENDPVH